MVKCLVILEESDVLYKVHVDVRKDLCAYWEQVTDFIEKSDKNLENIAWRSSFARVYFYL
jgi:hypothetical protein